MSIYKLRPITRQRLAVAQDYKSFTLAYRCCMARTIKAIRGYGGTVHRAGAGGGASCAADARGDRPGLSGKGIQRV